MTKLKKKGWFARFTRGVVNFFKAVNEFFKEHMRIMSAAYRMAPEETKKPTIEPSTVENKNVEKTMPTLSQRRQQKLENGTVKSMKMPEIRIQNARDTKKAGFAI